MGRITDIKTDRESPNKGDEVGVFIEGEGDELIIMKKLDFRCWLRITLTPGERFDLIRGLLLRGYL